MNFKRINQIYNGSFRLSQNAAADFPDGWLRTGGSAGTVWQWLKPPEHSYAVLVQHPGGLPAGIAQDKDAAVPAGEAQHWEVCLRLHAAAAASAYLWIHYYASDHFLRVAKYDYLLPQGEAMIKQVFVTPRRTTAFTLNLGLLAGGSLIINKVFSRRLYPQFPISLDTKGQVLVGRVDTVGKIEQPVTLAGPIEVTVTSDIRDLTPTRDGVRIYGSSPLPVATTAGGVTLVQTAGHDFYQQLRTATATPMMNFSPAIDVSPYSLFSYAVYNSGSAGAVARLEISPDNTVWVANTPEKSINGGQLVVLTPTHFLRYTRLAYSAATPTTLTAWFQAQS